MSAMVLQVLPMRIILLSLIFMIHLFQIFSTQNLLFVSGRCLEDQKSSLLTLKDSLTITSIRSTKLVRWKESIDCCLWDGIECDSSGHVIKLELDDQTISGEITNSSTLFNFQHLEWLNLAFNNFNSTIPSGLHKLTNLTYLNLSNAGFSGQIPGDLGRLRRLVILDLSTRLFGDDLLLKTEKPNLKIPLENLTELRELYLDGVNISAQGNDWCKSLSSLSNLRVLSLIGCYLSGPISPSLLHLGSLSVIHLDANEISTIVPDFFASFSNLTTLSLSANNLRGNFPEKILQVPTLQNLDLSINNLLEGSFPEFPQNGSFKTIAVSQTKFSGSLPDSIGYLGNLSKIDLSDCNFTGPIPSTVANLKGLVYLDFSFNSFNGPIPSFHMSKKLKYIDLSGNYLTGTILSTHFDGLVDLSYINLGFNSIGGSIPPSLFSLRSLQKLQLSNNYFEGQINEFPVASASWLNTLDLSGNQLRGSIPESLFKLERLNVLSLSSNSFNGTLRLEIMNGLPNLSRLELSYNNLSIDASNINSRQSNFSQLCILKLASCNLRAFPDLRNQSMLSYLDLSDNQIAGNIPRWIWEVGNGWLNHLNLSFNLFVGLENYDYSVANLVVLDLHSNQLQGDMPIPPISAAYVDYSFNKFSNSIPPYIANTMVFFSVSNNNLTGAIPESICTAGYLQFLDLSNNALTGSIPDCLFETMENLQVLDLGRNNLNGTIPDNFPANCVLKTLDLGRNRLGGQIPGSLVNCASLEFLNIGSNKIEDTFPCELMNSSSLRVLVLRSNMLHGNISCFPSNNSSQNLQIVDISLNNISGTLSSIFLSNWGGMIRIRENGQPAQNDLHVEILSLVYYQDGVEVTLKGLDLHLVKIPMIFTSIDFSCNNFEGNIPEALGQLKALHFLNLSHNNLSGAIPKSIGNLTQLESLDLSENQLSGMIAPEITGLTFLSFLNLSFNKLVGRIPPGPQFQTFTEMSFEGNNGLCGFPLNKSCKDDPSVEESSPAAFGSNATNSASDAEFDWQVASFCVGFAVGASISFSLSIMWQLNRIK